MTNSHNHSIRNIFQRDGVIYAPLLEVSNLCKRFPSVSALQISEVIDNAVKQLLADPEKLKAVKEITTQEGVVPNDSPKTETPS